METTSSSSSCSSAAPTGRRGSTTGGRSTTCGVAPEPAPAPNLHLIRTDSRNDVRKLRPVQRRIAVIEDEATIAASVAARLRAEGYEVETAADGFSGVELSPEATGGPIRLGQLVVDPDARLVSQNGRSVHLTVTEFDLLLRLARSPSVVLGRRRLLEEVWGYQAGGGERTVDSHVRAIRRKLGPTVIRTVRGVGYAADVEGDA